MNVDNLISDSSAFSISSLYICKFLVQVLLKPDLKDFEQNLTCMWNEHNCMIVCTLFGTFLLWDWKKKKTDFFQSCGHCWVFQICWHIKYSSSIGNKTNFKHPWMVALEFCSISCLSYRTGLSFQRWEPSFTQNSKINRITLWIKITYPSTRQAWVWV